MARKLAEHITDQDPLYISVRSRCFNSSNGSPNIDIVDQLADKISPMTVPERDMLIRKLTAETHNPRLVNLMVLQGAANQVAHSMLSTVGNYKPPVDMLLVDFALRELTAPYPESLVSLRSDLNELFEQTY